MIWAALTSVALLILAVWYMVRRAAKKGKIQAGHDQLKETTKNVEKANEAANDSNKRSTADKRRELHEDWGGE